MTKDCVLCRGAEGDAELDVVEVWRDDRDLLWRWRYLGHDGTDLLAHRSFPTREAAVEAAVEQSKRAKA